MSRNKELADEKVLSSEKSLSLPIDCSHSHNNGEPFASSTSTMCLYATSESLSPVDVGLDSSWQSSTTASDFAERSSIAELSFSSGKLFVDYKQRCCKWYSELPEFMDNVSCPQNSSKS